MIYSEADDNMSSENDNTSVANNAVEYNVTHQESSTAAGDVADEVYEDLDDEISDEDLELAITREEERQVKKATSASESNETPSRASPRKQQLEDEATTTEAENDNSKAQTARSSVRDVKGDKRKAESEMCANLPQFQGNKKLVSSANNQLAGLTVFDSSEFVGI